MTRIGIIGNGVAATTAVREIRSKNQDVEIDVFTDVLNVFHRGEVCPLRAAHQLWVEYHGLESLGKDQILHR